MAKLSLDTTLSAQAFYILLALAERSLHGYGIRDQVAHDSGSRIIMATGTTYIILGRLVRDGLIIRGDGRQPRYSLTKLGRRRLLDETNRLEHAVIDARRKLGAYKLPNALN